jgi:two-component system CheB/CheR fusion protein
METLLEYIKRDRGFDFTGYKRTSLSRRIQKRMTTVGVDSFSDYVDFLEDHPEEFPALFSSVLINVTGFFRDEASWSYLAERVLPDLLARPEPGERATATLRGVDRSNRQLRVWSAGCATGEEAYTLAMILAEQLGVEAFRERVKIYATDVDTDALSKAKRAAYTEHEVANVPETLLGKYFERTGGTYTFRRDLRRQVIFGRHDLTSDAPISRLDLLVCRNTLMYLNAEVQTRILKSFHFALNDGGVLFLGRAETLLAHASPFAPIDLKRRISRKISRTAPAIPTPPRRRTRPAK